MRLCSECKWSTRGWFATLFNLYLGMECTHPALSPERTRTDPVSGKIEGGGNPFCAVARMHSSDMCSYNGNLWEAR